MRPSSFVTPLQPLAGCVLALSLTAIAFPASPETELKDETGKTIVHYVVDAPAGLAPAGTKDSAKQVGLFLCFQEHGTPTGNDIFPVREALRRQGLSDNYVLIAAHSQDPAGKMGTADYEPLQKLLQWAEKTYPINPRRVYMYGKGEGGKISGEFAGNYPNLVTAAITYSWGWWKMPSEQTEPIDPLNSSAELYMVLGLRDLSHHIIVVRDTYERVRAKGYHVIYREFSELGDRTYHPPSNDDAIAWATRLRNKNIKPTAEEMDLLKPYGKSTPPAAKDGYYPALALVGGAPAGAVVRNLLESKDANVRAAAAETCSHAIFDEPTAAALGNRVTDSSVTVRRAALRALSMYANWRSEASQQALVRAVTDTNASQDDRVDAADALAQAVRFQVKGVIQDPAMFKAMVGLLTEQYEPLRAVARLTLATVRDPDYKPAPKVTERKTPEGGWQGWLDGVTAKSQGDQVDYKACGSGEAASGSGPTSSANRGGSQEPVDLFCMGGASMHKDPAQGFKYTLQAAEKGYVPAEEAVGMMYVVGKGVQQDIPTGAKWMLQAAEGGNARAVTNFNALFTNGEGGLKRDKALADRWNKFIADHPVGASQ